MAYKAHQWPGLSKPVYLPDDIPVEIKLITNSRFRGGGKSTAQTLTTWHDTGPTGGTANAEWSWANKGREGAGPGGYNAIIGDDKIIISQAFDEIVWHAGTEEGNRISWGAEQCREGVNRTKAIRNAAAFHGALCAAKGWEVDTHLVQHHYWYGKNCPSYIRATGLWSSAVKQTSDFAVAARAAAGGLPGPVAYAKPDPIPALDAISKGEGIAPQRVYDPSSKVTFIWVGDRVSAIRTTGRYRWADEGAERVGPDIRTGEEFDVDFIFQTADKTWWYMTPWHTRIRADDVERVADSKGEEAA